MPAVSGMTDEEGPVAYLKRVTLERLEWAKSDVDKLEKELSHTRGRIQSYEVTLAEISRVEENIAGS